MDLGETVGNFLIFCNVPQHIQLWLLSCGWHLPKVENISKAVKKTESKKNLDFHNAQAAARKDVERAFGIL